MKRAFSLFLICAIFIFGGCASKPGSHGKNEPPTVPDSYTAELFIDYNGNESQAHFVQNSLGSCEIEFVSPKTLSGLKLTYNGTQCTLSLGGLSLNAELANLPETNFGKAMIDSFTQAASNTTVKKTYSGGKWHYDGETSGNRFKLVQNAETGLFESFELPSASLKIELKDITVT